jgi:transposase
LLASGELRLADGTLIGVANYAGCAKRSEFAGTAAYGYCAAKSQYVWGVRLVLITDRVGVPVGYTLVPANEKEYEPVRELTTAQAGCLLIADKGYWGRAYAETLALQGVTIRTPDRVRTADNLAREKRLASLRLVIESTISNLKCQMRLEQHLAKTPQGLVQRIAQRLLALTIGMLLNALHGRPPRALVAYDGR